MKPEKMKAKIELYHAATEIISKPLCGMGRRDLDFGPGFYMTDIYDQAVMWANRRANERKLPAILRLCLLPILRLCQFFYLPPNLRRDLPLGLCQAHHSAP